MDAQHYVDFTMRAIEEVKAFKSAKEMTKQEWIEFCNYLKQTVRTIADTRFVEMNYKEKVYNKTPNGYKYDGFDGSYTFTSQNYEIISRLATLIFLVMEKQSFRLHLEVRQTNKKGNTTQYKNYYDDFSNKWNRFTPDIPYGGKYQLLFRVSSFRVNEDDDEEFKSLEYMRF